MSLSGWAFVAWDTGCQLTSGISSCNDDKIINKLMITKTFFLYAGIARTGAPVAVQDCGPTIPLMHTTPTSARH